MAYVKKRFIAGASCPGCGQSDTVYTLVPGVNGNVTSRHCSRCDFVAFLDLQSDPPVSAENKSELQVINLQPQNSDKS